MKRFSFNLERVLKLRKSLEKEAEIELGRRVGALSELEGRLKRTAEEKFLAAESRFSKNHGFNEIRSYELYILRLDKTRDTLLEAAAKAEQLVEKARSAYRDASRDRRVLDKLKERRLGEYRKALLAEEVKILDDISGGQAARKLINRDAQAQFSFGGEK